MFNVANERFYNCIFYFVLRNMSDKGREEKVSLTRVKNVGNKSV